MAEMKGGRKQPADHEEKAKKIARERQPENARQKMQQLGADQQEQQAVART